MKIAIQGELGSNSHMAALEMLRDAAPAIDIVACGLSVEVFERMADGSVEGAVLPIENSLHGSVAEHYDLLLAQPVCITRESLMRIGHNLIACPGVRLEQIRRVLSHSVALAQCRRFFERHREIQGVPFYDTAGSVKHILGAGLEDAAAIAPLLAAEQYGGLVLETGVEDHPENFTRFHLVVPAEAATFAPEANKISLAFSVEHRPGTLLEALRLMHETGVDLTKIESRPVRGRPWEYVFFVDVRFQGPEQAEQVMRALRDGCGMVKQLGRYVAA